MRIRIATSEDASVIASLHAASWRSAYRGMLSDTYLGGDIVAERTAVWSKRLGGATPNQYVVIAEAEHRAVGFACAFGANDAQWGSLLDNLHVAHEVKRRGIGRQLMTSVARWCLQMYPGTGLFLWVLEPNSSARRFYERLGAANVGQDVWSPPDGGAVPKLRYAWKDPNELLQCG